MYTAVVSLGTPAQEFNMICDTGSSCLWVMSAAQHQYKHAKSYLHYFDHKQSSSYAPYNATFDDDDEDRDQEDEPEDKHRHSAEWSIQYGVGRVRGFLSTDTVRLGADPAAGAAATANDDDAKKRSNLTDSTRHHVHESKSRLIARQQVFAEATHLTRNFANSQQPLDGLVGLSFRGGSCRKWPTLLDSLAQQHAIRHKVFAFYFSSHRKDMLKREHSVQVERETTSDTAATAAAADTVSAHDSLLLPMSHHKMTHSELILGQPTRDMYQGELHWSPVLRARPKRTKHHHSADDALDRHEPNETSGQHADKPVPRIPSGPEGVELSMLQQQTRHTSKHAKDENKSKGANGGGAPVMWFIRLNGLSLTKFRHISHTTLHLVRPDDEVPTIALPDSGTSFLTCGHHMFVSLVNFITEGRADCFSDRRMNVFCLDGPTGLPTLTFRFGDREFTLLPRDYLLANHQLAIQTLDFGIEGVNVLILGDAFLRSVFTVFDADNWRIGMAMSRQAPNSQDESGFALQSGNSTARAGAGLGSLLFVSLLSCIACLMCCECCCRFEHRRRQRREYAPLPT